MVIRVLIIEDDPIREEKLRSWLPPDIRPVVATSAGKAIGILQRDRGTVYAGIILDHDLRQRPASESDQYLSGQHVVNSLIQYVSPEVPILIHSRNPTGSALMARQLGQAGFHVERIPMDTLIASSY